MCDILLLKFRSSFCARQHGIVIVNWTHLAGITHSESEKLDPFHLSKYCPSLILSLLRTEINCDQVYPKSTTPEICQHEQECIGQRCWDDFKIKDAIVRRVTLSVTDMDKTSIVSSHAVLKVSSSTDTCSKSSSPLVSSLVKNRLFQIIPDIDCLNSSTLSICLW